MMWKLHGAWRCAGAGGSGAGTGRTHTVHHTVGVQSACCHVTTPPCPPSASEQSAGSTACTHAWPHVCMHGRMVACMHGALRTALVRGFFMLSERKYLSGAASYLRHVPTAYALVSARAHVGALVRVRACMRRRIRPWHQLKPRQRKQARTQAHRPVG